MGQGLPGAYSLLCGAVRGGLPGGKGEDGAGGPLWQGWDLPPARGHVNIDHRILRPHQMTRLKGSLPSPVRRVTSSP